MWDRFSRGVLMDKGNASAASSAAKSLIGEAQSKIPQLMGGIGDIQGAAREASGRTLAESELGFNQQQTWGGYDPAQLTQIRQDLGGMQPTGGYDPTQLANLRGEYSQYLPSGGYDPTQLAGVRGELSSAAGGYQRFADTGGWDPGMQQQYMQQATAGNRNLTNALAGAARRSAAATGGNAQAALADIARSGGQTEATATSGAALGLQQQIAANKLAGLGGLGTIAGTQAGLEGGVSAGTRDIMGRQAGTEADVAAGGRAVAGLRTGLESGVASGVQGANVGLAGLYNTATGQVTAEGQQLLQALGLQYGTEAQGAQILQELSKNPGWFQTMIGDIADLGGAAGGIIGGINTGKKP